MLLIQDPTQEMFSELRSCNDEQKEWINKLREIGREFIIHLDKLPACRRKSIALTELETAVLFATKAATYGS